jgi:hypothetical protein
VSPGSSVRAESCRFPSCIGRARTPPKLQVAIFDLSSELCRVNRDPLRPFVAEAPTADSKNTPPYADNRPLSCRLLPLANGLLPRPRQTQSNRPGAGSSRGRSLANLCRRSSGSHDLLGTEATAGIETRDEGFAYHSLTFRSCSRVPSSYRKSRSRLTQPLRRRLLSFVQRPEQRRSRGMPRR